MLGGRLNDGIDVRFPIPFMNDTILSYVSMVPTQSSVARKPISDCFVRVPFFLEVPSYLMEVMPLPNPVPRWFIDAGAVDATMQKLAQLGVSQSFLNILRQPDKSVQSDNWVVFFPPPGELAALHPTMRAAVYQVLREFSKNEDIVTPFVFSNREDLQNWFADTQIRPELISLIEQLTYPWAPRPGGNALAFSDLAVLIGQTRGESEARRVMRVLNRTPTLQLKIAIQPGSDPARLTSKWASGQGDRGWRAATMISSWCHAKEPGLFDVTHLLPQIPRMLLYTFPSLSMGMGGGSPDAHWTTQHFFRSEAGPARRDSRQEALVFQGLTPVDGPYQFGDVLVFWDKTQQKMLHSCVYVADSIVFTKNSPKLISPWVLQEWDIVKNIHSTHPEDHIQGYRKVLAGLN